MTVMSDTPAARAKSSFVQPLAAASSAISWSLNRTRVDIVSTQYGDPAQLVNTYFQRVSTAPTRPGLRFTPVAQRPVYHPNFGRFLRTLREAKGWNQKETADIAARRGLPLTRQQLLHLEQGKTLRPEREALRAIAMLYEKDYGHIVSTLVHEMYAAETTPDGRAHVSTTDPSDLSNRGLQPATTSLTLRATESTDELKSELEGEARLLKSLTLRSWGTVSRFVSLVRDMPHDEERVCRAVEGLIDRIRDRGVPAIPKTKRHSGGVR